MRASVAMAVYNGEKYLNQQIQSIQKQLSVEDELVISYNVSTDKTLEIIRSYAERDPKIKVIICEAAGVKENFTNAVEHCSGSYIFFSDQDDVWFDNKLERVLQTFRETGASMVIHNARYTDADLNVQPGTIFQERRTGTGVLRNIIKGGFFGCCMAFKRELTEYIFPLPDEITSHDMWAGLLARLYGKLVLLDEELLYYRRHDSTLTPTKHFPLSVMLKNRYLLVKNLLIRRAQLRVKK